MKANRSKIYKNLINYVFFVEEVKSFEGKTKTLI